MKNAGLYIISFFIGAGILYGYIQSKSQINLPKTQVQKPIVSPTYSVETPPSESLQGIIASRSGTLFWESRIASSPSELTGSALIQQGERLITKNKSSAQLNFDTACSIILSENADLSFIQTIPVDFVVEQKTGSIIYVVNGATPLSIRLRNALITKLSGMIEITITDGDPVILITTTQGTAQIGFNDLDYVSQIFTLREGQIYEYDSDNHTTINTKNK